MVVVNNQAGGTLDCLLHEQSLIGRYFAQSLHASGRPTNFYRCFVIRIESKVHGEVLAGGIADRVG